MLQLEVTKLMTNDKIDIFPLDKYHSNRLKRHKTTMFDSRTLVLCDAQVMSAWHGQYRPVPNTGDSFNNSLGFILLSTTTRLGKTLAINR